MAILNLFSATFVNPPSGLWEVLLRFFSKVSEDYAWRIIIFTVLLKLLFSPLDFYQRYKMKKNEQITKKIQPEMDKLNKQYADDRATLSQKTMQLQRQAGFSFVSACIPMLVTLIVFISFWSGMRNIAQYEEFKQYVNMYDTYIDRYYELSGTPLVEGTGEIREASSEFDEIINGWGQNLTVEQEIAAFNAYKQKANFTLFYQDYLSKKQLKDFYNEVIRVGDSHTYSIDIKRSDDREYDLEKIYNFTDKNNSEYKTAVLRVVALINGNISSKENKPDLVTPIDNSVDGLINLLNDIDSFDKLQSQVNILLRLAENDSANAVWLYYKDNGPSFLWVKSIWIADVPWAKAVSDYADFTKNTPKYMQSNDGQIPPSVYNEIKSEETYNKIMLKVKEDDTLSKTNGYLILVILTVGFSLLSSLIMGRQQRRSGQQMGQMGAQMKMMMYIMPLMMGIFAISTSSAFTLYMMTNSFMSLIITLLSSFIVNQIAKRGQSEEISSSGVIRYGRKDPNDINNKRSK